MYIPVAPNDVVDPPGMHIPDGFVDAPVSVVGYVLAGLALGFAIRKINAQMGEKAAPLMGVVAAFIFAAQMINFPVSGGTSGHLLGGTLAAVLIGPYAAVIAMAAVISVQALVFQDGGIAALGANVFNMGVITAFAGYGIFKLAIAAFPRRPAVQVGAAFAGAWISVLAAATFTSFELAFSGTSDLDVALPAMLGVHVFIGLGEALITGAAVAFVQTTRPDLLEGYEQPIEREVAA
jgi:cobalt/nickel transport system permease protein